MYLFHHGMVPDCLHFSSSFFSVTVWSIHFSLLLSLICFFCCYHCCCCQVLFRLNRYGCSIHLEDNVLFILLEINFHDFKRLLHLFFAFLNFDFIISYINIMVWLLDMSVAFLLFKYVPCKPVSQYVFLNKCLKVHWYWYVSWSRSKFVIVEAYF